MKFPQSSGRGSIPSLPAFLSGCILPVSGVPPDNSPSELPRTVFFCLVAADTSVSWAIVRVSAFFARSSVTDSRARSSGVAVRVPRRVPSPGIRGKWLVRCAPSFVASRRARNRGRAVPPPIQTLPSPTVTVSSLADFRRLRPRADTKICSYACKESTKI